MSDEQHDEHQERRARPDELHESPLSAADDQRIRRLLAQARHTEPMPDHVTARLDRVLTGLSTERAGRDAVPVAPVVDLAARRRRTAANLLVAAAAVVVLGVGVTQLSPGLGGDGADSPTAVSADQAEAGGGAAAPEDSAGGSSRGIASQSPEVPGASGADQGQAFRVRSARFGPDVRKIRNELLETRSPAPLVGLPKAACTPDDTEGSTLVAASYDGAPATLVLRQPAGDVQVVDLYLCGDTAPRRSITLTAP